MIPFVDSPRPVIWRTYVQTLVSVHFQHENSSGTSSYKESYSPRMDLRQTIFDLPLQSVITRDNVEITVHPMMVIQITDPVRVCYEVGC